MRRLKTLLCAVLACILVLSTTCPVYAASDEKKITKQVNKYFGYVKNYDHVAIDKMMYKRHTVRYWKLSSLEKTVKKINKKSFKYQIDTITVKGNKATVKVKVLYYDGYISCRASIKEQLQKILNKKQSKIDLNAVASDLWKSFKYDRKYYNKHLAQDAAINYPDTFSEDFAEYTEYYSYASYKIPMIKKNGKWYIQKMTANMRDTYDCDTSSTILWCLDNPFKVLWDLDT